MRVHRIIIALDPDPQADCDGTSSTVAGGSTIVEGFAHIAALGRVLVRSSPSVEAHPVDRLSMHSQSIVDFLRNFAAHNSM